MATAAVPPHRYHHLPKPPEGSDRWICFYPAYINKDKTLKEGRRIPKEKAVLAPNCKEIAEVLSTTGLKIFVENKIYCREISKEPNNWGRIRIQLKNNDSSLVKSNFKSRDDVFLYVAENIPKLKSRVNPKGGSNVPSGQQQQQGKGKKKK